MKLKFLLPLLLFVGLVAFLASGLGRDPHELPSPFIGRQAPAFEVPQLTAVDENFSPESMRGKVWVMNVWASWCSSCREEHPVLLNFAKTYDTPLIGLDYKDQRKDALNVLRHEGDPYVLSAFDANGRVGINYGVYGVPETYVIDKQGIIRHKHIGPLTPEVVQKKIIPLINSLNKT